MALPSLPKCGPCHWTLTGSGAGMNRFLSPLLLLFFVGVSIAGPAVTAKREGTQVVFRAGDREMFRYHAEPAPLPRPEIKEAFVRGGYLHPLLTPSGKLVS